MSTSITVYQHQREQFIMVLFDLKDAEQHRTFCDYRATFKGDTAVEWLDEEEGFAVLHLFPGIRKGTL